VEEVMIERAWVLCPVFLALGISLAAQTAAGQATAPPAGETTRKKDTLEDVSVMKFTVGEHRTADALEIKNVLYGADTKIPAPAGQHFVVVTLIGELPQLREKYGFVAKIPEQFVALEPQEKQFHKALLIKGILGWERAGRSWALGKATQVKWQDKEEFTVAFALPRELTRFQVAIRKLAGDDVVLAGAVDLARKRESTTRR
jgi:hypothetical protein